MKHRAILVLFLLFGLSCKTPTSETSALSESERQIEGSQNKPAQHKDVYPAVKRKAEELKLQKGQYMLRTENSDLPEANACRIVCTMGFDWSSGFLGVGSDYAERRAETEKKMANLLHIQRQLLWASGSDLTAPELVTDESDDYNGNTIWWLRYEFDALMKAYRHPEPIGGNQYTFFCPQYQPDKGNWVTAGSCHCEFPKR